jgi:hypothetical protein
VEGSSSRKNTVAMSLAFLILVIFIITHILFPTLLSNFSLFF